MDTIDPALCAGMLLTAEGRADPYPIYRELRAHGPAVRVPGGPLLVVGYRAAQAALRDPRLLVEDDAYLDGAVPGWRRHRSRSVLNRSMIFVDGAEHDRMRRLVGRAFTRRRVAGLRPVIESRIARLLDRVTGPETAGPVDVMDRFAFQVPVNVIGDLLGVPEVDRAGFRRPVSELALAVEPGWASADMTAADRAAAELVTYFGALVAERRSHPGTDLISTMIEANGGADEPLSTDELAANLVFLLLAGFETTVGLLGNGLLLLLQRPALLTRLREHPGETAAFVAEFLRYDAPVQLTGRRAAERTEIGGVDVPRGEPVIVVIGAANHDPDRFTHPDRFDPDRQGNQPLSFGGGVHYCLGAHLAVLEAHLAFPMFLHRFPNMAGAGRPVLLDRFNLRGYAHLPVLLG